jgi:hypothetical protein
MNQKKYSFAHLTNGTGVFLLVFTLLLVSIQNDGIAQQRSSSSSGNHEVIFQEFLKNHSATMLVKLYHSEASDPLILQTIRMEMILENPAQFPEFDKNALEQMKTRLDKNNQTLKQISVFMTEGDSYQIAKARMERYKINSSDSEKANHINQPSINTGN